MCEDASQSLQQTGQTKEISIFEDPDTCHEQKEDSDRSLYSHISHGTDERALPSDAFYDLEAGERAYETYEVLVRQGGRPVFPLSTLDRAEEHPHRYKNLKSAWQEVTTGNMDLLKPVDFRNVYKLQLYSWENFRYWQYDNRGMEDGSLSAAAETAFGKRSKHLIHVHPPGPETYPAKRAEKWQDFSKRRETQRQCHREVAKGSPFAEYVAAVKARLQRHGYYRLFELREDPDDQTARETWIEYLNYEYWWCDRRKESRDQSREHCRLLWQQLVDAGYTIHKDDQDNGDTPGGSRNTAYDLERQLSKTKQATPSAYAKIQRLEAEITAKKIAEMRCAEYGHCFKNLRLRRQELIQQHKRVQWVLEELGVVEEEEEEERRLAAKKSAADDGTREKGKREQKKGSRNRHSRKRARLGDITDDMHDLVRARRRTRTPEPLLASAEDEENKENSKGMVAPVRYDSESEYSDASY